ncbi:MAG: general secretion pathway protein GspG [Parachlamydiales bacterium]|nr:general secretion pathway protein GspG [Parachlamydiales bacterium]
MTIIRQKKRHLTLIEIMIVIFLIGLIGGVLAFNFKGTLDEGKVFKTEQGIETVHNILMLDVAQGSRIEDVVQEWTTKVRNSSLAGKPEALLRDGWGEPYNVALSNDGTDITISSKGLEKHKEKQRSKDLR